jgi:hypothetical protein
MAILKITKRPAQAIFRKIPRHMFRTNFFGFRRFSKNLLFKKKHFFLLQKFRAFLIVYPESYNCKGLQSILIFFE